MMIIREVGLMAENLPVSFAIPSENVIASYDYTDIAEGTGMQTFYGFAINEGLSGAVSYALSEKLNYSTQLDATTTAATITIHTSGATIVAEEDPANSFDLDFDLTAFNNPKVIKGTAIAQIPWGMYYTPSGAMSGALIIQLAKVSGGTETIFASGAVVRRINNSGTLYSLSTLKIPISTEQKFKKGDILRMNAIGRVLDSGGSAQIGIAHDPMDRSGSSVYGSSQIGTRVLKINVPFKIDT
jgi:hypothetical protein